jgi:hypothetical protein
MAGMESVRTRLCEDSLLNERIRITSMILNQRLVRFVGKRFREQAFLTLARTCDHRTEVVTLVSVQEIFTVEGIQAWHNPLMQLLNFGLLYLEKDPRTQQPSACISVKSSGQKDFAGVPADQLISGHCLNFIQLDAEIRRLHAELDEIRAQAKKKFYKTELAVGAATGA